MRGRLAEIRAAGADLAFVGNGSVPHARQFQARHVPGCDVYTDPARRTYEALGMRRSVGATLGPASTAAFVRATLRGHRQTSIEGDPWQQGGLVVLAAGGGLLHVQRNRTAGDRPDVDAALAALSGQPEPDPPGAKPARRARGRRRVI